MVNYSYSRINQFSLRLKKGQLTPNFEANKDKLTLIWCVFFSSALGEDNSISQNLHVFFPIVMALEPQCF